MSASTELERAEPEAKTPDIARPVISPAEAEQMVTELRQLIARILVENKHYQKIKGKDVLLKAGAEELGKFFGFSSQYEDLQVEQVEVEDAKDGGKLKKVWAASVKCSVSNREGRVLAESYGFYSGDERTDRTGKISPQPANTIVKMAQKRAYVGAILTATGTSELFTQDIDDAHAAAAPSVAQAVDDRMASDAEQRLLIELFIRKGGKTAQQAKEWLDSYGPKGASANWVARQVMNLSQRPDVPIPTEDDPAKAAAEVKPTTPELPVDEPELVESEVVDDDEAPF